MENRKRIIAYLLTLIFGWSLQSCADYSSLASQETPVPTIETVSQPPEGKFFFVELWVHYEGVGMAIDKPTYGFNPTTKIIKSIYREDQFPMSGGDWGLVGKVVSSIGAASGLKVVNGLPFEDFVAVFTGDISNNGAQEMQESPIKLLAISTDGTLGLEIDGQSFVLGVNEKWEHSAEADFIKDGVTYHYKITSSITNYGWLDRTQIQFRP